MILEYGGCSHRGKVRKSNEDYYYIPVDGEPVKLAIIADGMGGHNAGELASCMAVEAIREFFPDNLTKEDFSENPIELIRESIVKSNEKIFNFAEKDKAYKGMGTTLVLAYFHGGRLYLGHVGDSRGYLIRQGTLTQITKDHSLVQELLDNGTITQDEVETHPQKNIITRALGTDEIIDVDSYELPLEDGDIILLCTDGLILHVDLQDNIELIESGKTMNEIASILVEQALAEGGLDNITAVVIKYSSTEKEG